LLNIPIIVLAAILLLWLLFLEKRENRKAMVPTKALLSALFVIAAFTQAHPLAGYFRFLVAGLILCLWGDICLALPQKKLFLLGLVFFLLGQVSYVLAFFSAADVSMWTWAGSLMVMAISSLIYCWLRPHLGTMTFPVLLYVILISVMIAGAWTVLGDSRFTQSGRIMIFIGGLAFYFSDIFVARDRFIKREFPNRLIGLPLYFAGQFLLAFSVGQLRQVYPA
jgi:uncharacterized membrane protein YhhN